MRHTVKQALVYWEEFHPFHERINKKLIEEAERELLWTRDIRNADGGLTNVRALQTYPRQTNTKHVKIIEKWVCELIPLHLRVGLRPFVVDHSWMANYSKGDHTNYHDHGGWYSYVYYVKTPKGSSPLIFTYSGKRIKAEAGKVVIFPGNLYHHVPKNKCEGRITLAGNVTFDEKFREGKVK